MCSVLFEPSPRVNGFPATVTAQFTIAPCEPAYCSTAPGTAFACIPCAPPPGEPEPISPIVWLLVALAGAAVVALIGVIIYVCFCRKDNNKSLFDNIISSEESARVHVNPVSKKAPITSVRSELWTHPRHTNHIQHAERESAIPIPPQANDATPFACATDSNARDCGNNGHGVPCMDD